MLFRMIDNQPFPYKVRQPAQQMSPVSIVLDILNVSPRVLNKINQLREGTGTEFMPSLGTRTISTH